MPHKEFNFSSARRDLAAQVQLDCAQLSEEVRAAVAWPGVLESLARVPRERFVDVSDQEVAYHNTPLSIGCGQTISQPFIVALMTGALNPRSGQRVLEIGTGSGYQTAILAGLVGEVYSIEIVEALAERAKSILAELGIGNVHLRMGDGHCGWPEAAPFDGIIVTAAAAEVPYTLLAQLKPGGRMVVPLGHQWQVLAILTCDEKGSVRRRDLLPVRFVPFVEAGAGQR